MTTGEGFREYLEYLSGLAAEHNPQTCRTPGHIVISDERGNLYCGPGGYWPQDNRGIVYFEKRGKIVDYVEGTLVRVNQ